MKYSSFMRYCLDWIEKNLEKENPRLAGIITEFLLQRETEYENLKAKEEYEDYLKELKKGEQNGR